MDWIQQVAATLPPRLELPDGSSRPRRWSDIAVLYRKHQHREAIVERLREAGIPAVVTGGIGLFVQPEIRDLEAALRVLVDPEDSVSFTRLLSAGPWRLDAAEILRLTRAAAHDRRPVSEAAREIRRAGELLVDVAEEVGDDGLGTPAAPAELPHRHRLERLDDLLRAKLQRLLDCLDALAPRANREGPFTLLDEYLVRTSILRDLLAVGTTEAQRTVLAVARLLRFTAGWQREHPLGSLADFIAYLDIYQQVGGDPDVEPGGQVEVEGVQLMTVYQAKGLEFEAVVVPWLTEGQFPDERKEQLLIPVELLKQTPPDEFVVAEERRLGYVAMTRARSRLLLVAVDGVRERPSRFAEEIAPGGRAAARIPGPTASDGGVPAEGSPAEAVLATGARYRVAHRGDVTVIDRAADEAEQGSLEAEPPPLAADADAIAARTEARLERLLPVPAAFERRFALRRRAVELIGDLEQLAPGDDAARARLLDELVAVAADAAHAAEADRAAGLDPVTLAVVAGHDPAGGSLLQLAPLPYAFSHSQFWAYRTCPLQWTFQRLYRIPARDERTYFTFGSAIHEAFERFSQARRDATAAGEPLPGFETLEAAFRETWDPRAFPDVTTAEGYRARSAPILRRFYDRELTRESELLLFESPFVFELPAGEGEPPVRINGVIDRVDRLPDGSIELIDYKTGRAKSQADVDRDDQLTLYALALRSGVLADPATGVPLPPASRLTLYFTEADLWLSTTRTDEQLDACAAGLVELARRIRAGDFAATPGYDACRRCDYARLCPSRYEG